MDWGTIVKLNQALAPTTEELAAIQSAVTEVKILRLIKMLNSLLEYLNVFSSRCRGLKYFDKKN